MAEIKAACPHCPSSDAFHYNTEKKTGFCFSCKEAYPMRGRQYDEETLDKFPLENMGSSFEDDTDLQVTTTKQFMDYRGISARTMEFFGVKTTMSAGLPKHQEYIYPSGGVKVRQFPKTFRTKGNVTDELFGMNLFTAGTSKMITITEGELDAMSVWQMLGGPTSQYPTPVVSLPSSSPNKRIWSNVHDWLDSFEKIVLSIENDDAGNKVADTINNLFPGKVYRVDHSVYKDANEFLEAGKAKEFKSAWFGAQKYTPDNILHTTEQFLKLFEDQRDFNYVPTGIEEFDRKAMGIMQGHFTVFKAPTGIGKTELMRYLEWNFIQRGVTFATWHLEETKVRSLLGLVSYDLRDNLTRKDLVEEKGRDADVRSSIARIAGGGNFYQYFLKDGQGADELVAQIRMLKEAFGCQFVMFEPIQDVITVSSETSKEQELAELSVRLSKVAAESGVGIVTIAHTNEDNEIKYCRMIGQRASVIVRLDRDKEAPDLLERNTTRLFIEKNRPTSEEGFAGEMFFDPSTFTMGPAL